MSIKRATTVKISERPGPMALVVETTPFTIVSQGDKWIAEKMVTYNDDTVNITFVFRAQKGQQYKMTVNINQVDKEISGELEKNGVNSIAKAYPLSDFNMHL